MLRKLPLVDETAIEAIRFSVRQAIRRGWFRRDDLHDLTHDVVVQLLHKMECFDPSRSSWATFCTLIARNFLATEAKKRRKRTQVDSLQDRPDQDSSTCVEDSIEDRHAPGRRFRHVRSEYERVELRFDLDSLCDQLPDQLRELCDCYLDQSSLTGVADSLGVSRNTVYRRRQVLRECVAEECLHEYCC